LVWRCDLPPPFHSAHSMICVPTDSGAGLIEAYIPSKVFQAYRYSEQFLYYLLGAA